MKTFIFEICFYLMNFNNLFVFEMFCSWWIWRIANKSAMEALLATLVKPNLSQAWQNTSKESWKGQNKVTNLWGFWPFTTNSEGLFQIKLLSIFEVQVAHSKLFGNIHTDQKWNFTCFHISYHNFILEKNLQKLGTISENKTLKK